jgi:hypothetical protein
MKLGRAEANLRELRARVGPFLEGVSHEFRGEIDPERGKFAAYFVVNNEPPPEWSLMVGDLVHNVRSTVDHLVWGWVPRRHRSARTAFPILDDRDDFFCAVTLPARRKRRGPLTGLAPESARFQLIESVQPYNGQHGAEFHPLHNLAALSNEDKHRTMLGVTAGIPSDELPQLRIVESRNVELSNLWVKTTRPLQDGDQVMGADAAFGPDPHLEVEANIPIDVAFGEVMVTTRGLPDLITSVRDLMSRARELG